MENTIQPNEFTDFSPKTEEINEDALFVPVKLNEEESEHIAAEPYSYWKSVLRAFWKKPSAKIGVGFLVALVVCIIFIPLFAPAGSFEANISQANIDPSGAFLFGTDNIGRDIWFCCWKGLGTSLLLAVIVSVINITIGTLIGLAWGFFRRLDPILIELYNLFSNIPSLLLYMLLAYVFSNAFPDVTLEGRFIFSLVLFGWIGMALFIRNMTLIITNREYNVASITLGTPSSRIMIRNLLPHLLAVIITELSLTIPGVISSEVAMTYFGVGLDSKGISIGALLENGRKQFPMKAYQMLFPALILAIVIFTFYLLGLALSDALDPKKHR